MAGFPIRSMTALALALATAPTMAQTVTVAEGTLHGAKAGDLIVYKGIPYAAPPVGDRRWKAPAPAAKWSGVREATEFGADCVHIRADWEADRNGKPISEDCLFLNIWAPAKVGKAGAPVMFWIHGGGFVGGSGSQALYDGAALAERGVIVVTINYRLGRLGFFAHPALTAEAGGQPTGNWGFMDQIAALQWVKANIAKFGGDPKRVTIFGESAGGGSVNALMAMPAARGLFSRAIAESGGGRDEGVKFADAEARGKAFAESAGVTGNDLAALRAIPADKLMAGLSLLGGSATYSGPMIDGRLAPERIDVAFAAGRQAPVPYMAGANSYEIGFIPALARKSMTAMVGAKLGDALAGIKTAYGSDEAFDRNFAGDAMFIEPARFLTGQAAKHRSYLYLFDYVAEGRRAIDAGAPHGSELPFVFGTLNTLPVPATDADRAMAKAMGDYWANFAKAGNPNGAGANWPEAGSGQRMVFTASGAVAGSAASPALDAIARVGDARRETDIRK